ncbi:MAG: DUF370 domain-containing protein [Oscillospiraceae bacterium]|nr:DUF370 domain-containing protein [Oscillospiraceae bacterium]
MKLLGIGFGNYVSPGHVISIVSPDSAPIKRLVQETRDRGLLIDASFGRSTRSVIIADSGHAILSALAPEVLAARLEERKEEKLEEGSEKTIG